jgi:hypothetical protein
MISEQDKVRARDHLGYIGVGSVWTFSLGVPAALQTQFMVEGAFGKILPQHEAKFVQLLDRMDKIEQQIEDDTENVAADAIDEIKLRSDEFEQLLIRYKYWQAKLANLLGIVPNPFDQRWSSWVGGGGLGPNIPVIN